jgi:predicted solute-binding protein
MTVIAKEILSRMSAMVKAFIKDGYQLLVTGHSLGAGVAAILSILIKHELEIDNLKAILFATPPVISQAESFNC